MYIAREYTSAYRKLSHRLSQTAMSRFPVLQEVISSHVRKYSAQWHGAYDDGSPLLIDPVDTAVCQKNFCPESQTFRCRNC